MLDFHPASFTKENTTSIGTGDYVLAGAVTGFSAFSVASGGVNYYTTYGITDGTNWEVGVGQYVSVGNKITRAKVTASSSGGSPINWGAGTKVIVCGPTPDAGLTSPGLYYYTNQPGAISDYAHGFTPGMLWANYSNHPNNDDVYVCTEATVGAAVWKRLATANASCIASGKDASSGFGTFCYANADYSDASGLYAATYRVNSSVIGAYDGINSNSGRHQGERVALAAYTTSATAASMLANSSNAASKLVMPANSAILLDANIIAYSNASTLVSAWSLKALYRRGASGAPVLIGSPTATMLYQDAGASTWAVSTAVDSGNNAADISVTGAASTTIDWTADVRISHAML